MESKTGPEDPPDLLYEEIAGSTESLFRASTLKKLCSSDSLPSSSLTYSAASSCTDLKEVIRLRDSVSQIKTKVAVSDSPEQIRASIDLLRSSSFKFSQKRPKSTNKPEILEEEHLDTRKSAEHLIALADRQSVSEPDIQVTADVILQVFKQVGGRPTVEQLVTLVRRLKRVNEDESGELSRKLAEEQKRTDFIKEKLGESKEQVSALTASVKEHSSQVDVLNKAVFELYSLTKSINENWAKERKATTFLKSHLASDEAATITRSLKDTERRYAETKKMIGFESLKVTELQSKLVSSEIGDSVQCQTEEDEKEIELMEENAEISERVKHIEQTLKTLHKDLGRSMEEQCRKKEAQLLDLKGRIAGIEEEFGTLIALSQSQRHPEA